MTHSDPPPTAVVGTGRLARALLPALARAGYPITAVAGRSARATRSAVRLAPGSRAVSSAPEAAETCRLLLLAVPDRALAPLAASLARELPRGWRGRTVLHHAGALGLEPLAPLRRRGASVGLLHPMQCLGPGPEAGAVLPGSRARAEGTRQAMRVVRRLARDLGWVLLRFSRPLKPEDRTAYHSAASLVSNDLVALLLLGTEVLMSTGLSRPAAGAALAELARGTLQQVGRDGIDAALSGPVVRGDDETLEAQLETLRRRAPDAERIHRVLSSRLLAFLQGTEGALVPERSRAMERALGLSGAGRRGRSTV